MVPLRQALTEMGWPQGKSSIQTDNSTADGVVNNTIVPKRFKSMDMRLHWLRCRNAQGQFRFFWGSRHRQLGRLLHQTLCPHPPREPASNFCVHPLSVIIALPTRQFAYAPICFIYFILFYSLTIGLWEYKFYPPPSHPKACFLRVSARVYCTYVGGQSYMATQARTRARERPIYSNTNSRAGIHGGRPLMIF